MNLNTVPKCNRYTRASKDGTYIVCPNCEGASRVYNFAWSSLYCMYCNKPSEKNEWYNWGAMA